MDTTPIPIPAPAPLTTEQKLLVEGRAVAAKFSTEWGAFRRFLSANPLTGASLVAIAAFLLGGLVGHIF